MKFYIRSSMFWENPDQIINRHPCLYDFGFDIHGVTRNRKERILDENGNIILNERYEIKRLGIVIINNLEQLLALQKRVGYEIIVDVERDEPWIEIYDGYRE